MEKIKYDSLYKFIVSIGIAIIVFPFIFMAWIFNFNDIVVISNNEINQLTEAAQNIIHLEQNYKYTVLSHPIICFLIISIIVLSGGAIVLYGIKQWKNKVQKYEDKSRELSNKILEIKLRNLTPEEKEEKVKEEIKENTQEDKLPNKEIKSNNQARIINRTQIKKYMEIQNYLYDKIRKEFNDYKVVEEVKLGKQRYDCIALKARDELYDYIFEIKYFSSANSIKGKIRDMEIQMLNLECAYIENTKRIAKPILIIMVEKITDEELLKHRKFIEQMKKQEGSLTEIIISDVERIENDLMRIEKI